MGEILLGAEDGTSLVIVDGKRSRGAEWYPLLSVSLVIEWNRPDDRNSCLWVWSLRLALGCLESMDVPDPI